MADQSDSIGYCKEQVSTLTRQQTTLKASISRWTRQRSLAVADDIPVFAKHRYFLRLLACPVRWQCRLDYPSMVPMEALTGNRSPSVISYLQETRSQVQRIHFNMLLIRVTEAVFISHFCQLASRLLTRKLCSSSVCSTRLWEPRAQRSVIDGYQRTPTSSHDAGTLVMAVRISGRTLGALVRDPTGCLLPRRLGQRQPISARVPSEHA